MMILQKRWAYREKHCITGFRLEIFRNRRLKRCLNCSAALSTIFSVESQRKEERHHDTHKIKGGIRLTDEELLALPKVRVEDAARYLQNGTTAQEIRVLAQYDSCPFCVAIKGRGRYAYRVNVGRLMKFKKGELS